MAVETKVRTLVYKTASFQRGRHSLQRLLGRAMEALNTIGARRQGLGGGDESPLWLLIGQHAQDDAFFFGVLMRYAPGVAGVAVVDDVAALALTVERFRAPATRAGKQRELVDGLLFFAVSGNHVVVMQSAGLRAVQLERHLQWLLHEARVLPGDNTLELADRPTRAIADLLEHAEVRDVVIGGELSTPVQGVVDETNVGDAPRGNGILEAYEAAGRASEGILGALRSLLSEEDAARLNLDRLDESNLAYTLTVRYQRKTDDNGQGFMNRLGSALRHAEGVDAKIHLDSGVIVTGNQLRLTGPVRIQTSDGVPDPGNVFEAMRLWLLARLDAGELRA